MALMAFKTGGARVFSISSHFFACLAAGSGGGMEPQERIRLLSEQVARHPEDPTPVLQLARTHSHIWFETNQAEALQSFLKTLRALEQLDYSKVKAQISLVISAAEKYAAESEQTGTAAELAVIHAEFDGKMHAAESVSAQAQPDTIPAASSVNAFEFNFDLGEPEIKTEPVPAASPSSASFQFDFDAGESEVKKEPVAEPADLKPAVTAETETSASAPAFQFDFDFNLDEPQVEKKIAAPVVAASVEEQAGFDFGQLDTKPEVVRESIERPVLPQEQSENVENDPDKTLFVQPVVVGRDFQEMPVVADGIETPRVPMSEIDRWFAAGSLEQILAAYPELRAAAKHHVVEELIKRVDSWRIEPILAVAAMETDEKILKTIMRLVYKINYNNLCLMINIDHYSPDLQKVAVTWLAEMNDSAAIPQLAMASWCGDETVRNIAVIALGRLGHMSASQIPLLARVAREDQSSTVRHSAGRALEHMNNRQAWEALEVEATRGSLDERISAILKAMRTKFQAMDAAGKKGGGGKTDKPGKGRNGSEQSAEPSYFQKNQAVIFKAVLIFLLVIGFVWALVHYIQSTYTQYHPNASVQIPPAMRGPHVLPGQTPRPLQPQQQPRK